MIILDALLSLIGLPVTFCAAYLLLFTILSGKVDVPAPGLPRKRFRVLVPAHDESAGIAATVENLLALDYPRELFDVQVIADNCTDDTAERARAAGALVLVRTDPIQRGKGYALHYGFERLGSDLDAVVIIDADTLASKNLLRAFSTRLDAGARAIQADYAVRNRDASWRTRLVSIAFGAFHIVRSRGRERLGVSAGLRGNGMCFERRVLAEVPHEAYSIVEDVEYGIRLAEAGHRVVYADEAHVYGEMVSTGAAATSQRKRWEGGRLALAKRYGLPLLKRGLAGNRVLLDIALDVLVPPLSRVVVGAAAGLLAASTLAYFAGRSTASQWIYGFDLGALVIYVLRGWMVSGTGARGLFDLAFAPGYVVWKATLRMRKPAPANGPWVRTSREGKGAGGASD